MTAFRPDASAGSVYASRSGPITAPVVRAFSASCSTKETAAPRPATSAGSRPARVTAVDDDAEAGPAPPATMVRPTAEAVTTAAKRGGTLDHLAKADIDGLFLS